MSLRGWIGSGVLLAAVVGVGFGLALWKKKHIEAAIAASANPPEPMETVAVAVAGEREHRRTTTSIGTVMALRSITLKNEVPGTVRHVALTPGQVVEAGTVLVALDVSVEEAELKAQEVQAANAETVLNRARRAGPSVPEEEVDRARSLRDVAAAQIARTKAVIARKTIRAPFKARVGISDVHPGQYLNEGTQLTTLQGVDPAAHVDFSVAQAVAVGLREGDVIEVFFAGTRTPSPARIVAVDARVDVATRNAMVRARIEDAAGAPAPGSAVRVRIPVGPPLKAVTVPANALRKGAGGDHVFVIAPGADGKPRAQSKKVEVGTAVGDEVLIVAGVNVGEQVAASGSFKLRDGLLVVTSEGK